jgi:NAD(P)H-dependent flavin oxidoreductase YrpB (nitropropane dioxygenase family)
MLFSSRPWVPAYGDRHHNVAKILFAPFSVLIFASQKSVLIPACVDICNGYTSPLTKKPVQVVAAGGFYDGRGIAAALMLGASAVWVGTRFVTAKESGAPRDAKKAIIDAGFDATIKSTIWSGRPLRALKTDYISSWETDRRVEKEELQSRGILPVYHDIEVLEKEGKWTEELEDQSTVR